MPHTVRRATLQDLNAVAHLFDLYRQFYEQESHLSAAKDFIQKRLQNEESIIFVAESQSKELLGFTQLFPTFSSVGMKRIWILNDLFVAPEARGKKVAESLMQTAMKFSEESGARNLTLQTAVTNLPAQKLYEKLGWKRVDNFFSYIFRH